MQKKQLFSLNFKTALALSLVSSVCTSGASAMDDPIRIAEYDLISQKRPRTPSFESDQLLRLDKCEKKLNHSTEDSINKNDEESKATPIPQNKCLFDSTKVEEFFKAVQADDVTTLKQLLSESPDLVTCKNNENLNPIHAAVLNGKLESLKAIVKVCFKKHPELLYEQAEGSTGRGDTPLSIAVDLKKIDFTWFLLRYIPVHKIEIPNQLGETPLSYAALNGDWELIDHFLTVLKSEELYRVGSNGQNFVHLIAEAKKFWDMPNELRRSIDLAAFHVKDSNGLIPKEIDKLVIDDDSCNYDDYSDD